MKKTWALALTTAVCAATLGVAAAPAAAAETCHELTLEDLLGDDTTIDLGSVSINRDTLEIRVNPAAIDDDVSMLADLIVDEVAMRIVRYATCVEGGVVTGIVNCALSKALEIAGTLDPANLNLRYVYQDPTTGEIVVAGGLLVGDATACVPAP